VKCCKKKNGGNYLLVWDLLIWWGFKGVVELDYESAALPTELWAHTLIIYYPYAILYNILVLTCVNSRVKRVYGTRRLLPPLTAQKVETSSKIIGGNKANSSGRLYCQVQNFL